MEEFQSIMKNDVWEVVLRPKGKSIVTSKWLFNIKHGADSSVEKHKARFVAKGLFQKRELTMMKHLLLWFDILPSEPSLLLLQLWDGSYIKWM